jgi:hypothetical protein
VSLDYPDIRGVITQGGRIVTTSEYSAQFSHAPPFTDEMVIELLQHVETTHSTLLAQEQAHRMRKQKTTLYVRQMSPTEIIDTATTYYTHAPTEAFVNIAQAAVTGPSVDPTYMAILAELSEEQHDNQEFEMIVFLFLNSMKTLLKNRGPALSFVLNTLLQAKYKVLNAVPTLATLTPSQLARETGESPEYSIVSAMLAAGYVSMSSF